MTNHDMFNDLIAKYATATDELIGQLNKIQEVDVATMTIQDLDGISDLFRELLEKEDDFPVQLVGMWSTWRSILSNANTTAYVYQDALTAHAILSVMVHQLRGFTALLTTLMEFEQKTIKRDEQEAQEAHDG